MAVSYTREQRKLAKETGQRLYTVHVSHPKGTGGITVQGIMGDDSLDNSMKMMQDFVRKDKVKLAKKEPENEKD